MLSFQCFTDEKTEARCPGQLNHLKILMLEPKQPAFRLEQEKDIREK